MHLPIRQKSVPVRAGPSRGNHAGLGARRAACSKPGKCIERLPAQRVISKLTLLAHTIVTDIAENGDCVDDSLVLRVCLGCLLLEHFTLDFISLGSHSFLEHTAESVKQTITQTLWCQCPAIPQAWRHHVQEKCTSDGLHDANFCLVSVPRRHAILEFKHSSPA